MTTHSLKPLALLSGVAILTLGAAHAEARDNERSTSVSRHHGSVERQTNWENKRGTGSSTSTRQYSRETGLVTGSGTSTNAAGKTATSTTTGQKTETGYSSTTNYNGYNGHAATATKNVTKTEDGYDVDRNVTRTQQGKKWPKADVSKDVQSLSTSGTYSKNP